MAEQYKIKLGVGLNEKQLNSIRTTIDNLVKEERKIDLNIDFKIKNAQALANAGKEIEGLKLKLDELGDINLAKKGKSALPINTESVEKSIKNINESIKKLQNAFGRVDKNRGVQSLLTTVSKISAELTNVSKQFSELNKNLTSLSSKDFSINFGFDLGSNKKDPEQLMKELRVLEKEAREYEKYFYKTLNKTNKFDEKNARTSIYQLANKVGKSDLKNYLLSLDKAMASESDVTKVAAYKQYIKTIKELAGEKYPIASVEARLAESTGFTKLQNEANETEEKLKQLFSGGIDATKLHKSLEDIATYLKEIKTSASELSSSLSADGLTESFNKLSASLKEVFDNYTLVKNNIDNISNAGTSAGNVNGIENLENDLKQVENAAEKASDSVENLQNTTSRTSSASNISDEFKEADVTISATEEQIKNLQIALNKFGFSGSSIESIVGDIKQVGFEVNKITHQLNDDGSVVITVKGVDDLKNAVTAIKSVRMKDDPSGGEDLIPDIKTTTKITQSFNEIEEKFKRLKTILKELATFDIKFAGLDPNKNANEINVLTSQFNKLELELEELFNATEKELTISQIDELNQEIAEGDDKLRVFKARLEDIAIAQNITDDFERLKNLAKEISNLRIDIINSDDASDINRMSIELDGLNKEFDELYTNTKGSLNSKQISQLDNLVNQGDTKVLREFNSELNEFVKLQNQIENTRFEIGKLEVVGGKDNEIAELKRQLEELEDTYNRLMNTFMKKAAANGDIIKLDDFKNLENGITTATVNAENRLERFKSQYADTRAELARKIKVDIELGNFDDDVSRMQDKFDKLSHASKDLYASVDNVNDALNRMKEASMPNSDGVVDTERLIKAQQDYARAIERTNNLIDQQIRKESADARNQKLIDDRQIFQSKIDSWLTKNSAAAKDFGAKMLDLKAKAENCDRVTLNHLQKQFTKLDNAADKAGLKMMSFKDRIGTKLKEYSAYFSVAEAFMYITQGLKDMFEQVKLIDSAMTELRKVTDETDAAYNQFLSNAANKAKEIGTTIDGLVSSTADFARLGYGFRESQGLAEVANIYAVVGDDIDNVESATQSLISTLTAFKNEANGLSNDDFALSIVDKMNEVSNNFAISSGGIGDALQRSASSMMAANNSLDETIALITAANTVVQDPDAVGTAFKTISMRIRGAKTELEEAGLETEGMVESTAKLRSEIKALTGVDIMDGANQFKSTYQIMDELADKWQNLSDIQQATVTELIAGKRQGNIVSSLMNNFDIAENALNTSLNSSGSAMKEHEKYMDSIEAKLSQLKASWQGFAQTFMDSNFLKGGIDALSGFVDMLEKLVDNFGVLGTIGFGSAIFGLFKNRNNFSGILSSLSAFGQLASEAWHSSGKLTTRFKDIGKAAGMAGGDIVKSLTGSLSGMIGTIGLVTAAIGLAYNAYKKAKEEAAAHRQEVIESSDAYLDAASSFEKAYIKYSDKTDLTASEEEELKTAIQGTVDALGDKSGAIQGAINSNNDYLASLEAIKKAELDAARRAAEDKRDNARESLKETAIGYESWDGSEVDINLGKTEDKVTEIVKKVGAQYHTKENKGNGAQYHHYLTLDPNADTSEIIDYYYTLLNVQEQLKENLTEDELKDSNVYNSISSAIDKMSDSISVYTDGVYEAVKANYQLSQGIPKTAEEYVKMRESILRDKELDGFSFDKKMSIANTLDSEYSQLFDLSSAEIQARKFVGLIKGYGDGTKDGTDEIGQVETFLNMRTAVNNNECTVREYLSEFDKINSMTSTWNDEEKEIFNTTFGIDTDAIKKKYDDVRNYLSRNYKTHALGKSSAITGLHVFDQQEYINYEAEKFEEMLNNLTASELDAVVDIKTEIDWENTSLEDIQKQIQEQVKLNEALNFDADIEIDTTALEALNDILAESASAIGLSEESIDSLKSKYKDLDGYNPHTLFEKTANGVKVNRRELAKLEKKYNDLTKTEVQEHLDALVEEYDKCTKAIDGNIDSNKKLELISKREKYAQQIEELAEYQAQLEGVTGAYERWLNAQETPEDYEGYEKVATSREDIKDEISRGFLSNSTKEYIDLLSGEDLVGGTIDDYADAWARLDKKVGSTSYSIHDFFTVNDDGDITSTGIDRFFKGIQKDFKGEVYKFNEDTQEWYYDFSAENLKKIQDEWGIGIEAIELLLEAAASAGYDIDWGGIFDDLEIDTSNFEDVEAMITLAEKAQEEFNKIKGVEDVEFNFRANNIEEATTEVEKARKAYLDLITNKDGSINLKAEGAEQMQFMLSTLLTQKQRLSTPAIMKVDTSQIDKAETDIIDVINKAKELQTAYEKYEIAITTGVDVEGAKKDLNSAIEGMKGTSVDVRADLKLPSNDELEAAKNGIGDIKIGASLDDTSIGAIATKIQTECTPEVIAKVTGLDETAIQDGSQQVVYTAEHSDVDNFINSLTDISKKIIYEYTTEGTKPNPSNINRSIIYKYKTEGDVPEVNGTANANGTAQSGRAFARGNWGIKGSGTALVGELGMETLVRGGHFYTIGDNGAEFIKYKQGDIIFNHKQTEELFKNGKVTSDGGRGKMFANGSAYADGSHDGEAFAWGASASPSKFATTKIKDDGGTPKVKAETKTKVTKKNDGVEVNNEINLQPNISAKASDKSNSLNEVTEKEEEKAKNENKFEEAIDWIEIILDRAERAIDKYEQQSNNVYKTWAKRNKALENEINQVSSTISLYEKAKNQYLSEANSVGLSESYASKVRNGSLSVEDFKGESDEKLVKKIKNYQDLYDKYLNCVDKINELKEQEASLYSQRFENVQSEYDNLLQGFDHTESMLNEYISQAEEKGYIVSKNYYDALIDNEEDRISTLKQEQSALIKARDEAVANGEFDKYSEDWYKMCASIDEVTQAIESGTTSIIEYQNAIRDIDFEVFELIQERISDITAESDFLIELMSNKKLFSDKGNLTSQGFATMALHGQNYNSYMYQADDYGAEVAKLDKQIAKDPYDKELIDKRREYIELQREMILNAEEEKNAIKDLVSEGIELQLDSLSELIDKYNDALDSQKDLYDYQKRVEEQTKEISSLQKQLSAYEGDNSEEARAKIQELRVSLEEAESNLQETEYDKFISDQSALLDNLFLEAETIFNERIDNTDALVTEVIDGINAAANNLSIGNDNILSTLIGTESTLEGALDADVTNIQSTLTSEAEKVGTTLSNAMNSIWSVGDGSIKSVLSMYGNNFQNKQTTTNSTLSRIEVSVNSMLSSLNKEAEKKVTSNKTSSSDKKNPTTKAAETVKNLNDKKDNNDKKPALTDSKLKGIAAAIWVYGSKAGWEDDPTRKNKLTAKLGAENAKKVQGYINELGANGGLYKYWTSNNLKLDNYKYSAFKLGAKNVDETQLAWTQEQGREYIVRPSDGAILTPVAKGDSVLTSAATNNIWQMANSPAEFIKDNLNLGTTSVPNNSTIQNGYNQTIESVVFSMPNVRNYDELITQMQRDPNFERLVEAMSIGKLAGKSSLSKGKAIR